MKELVKLILSKLTQYMTSIAAGLLIAIETAIPAFVPCFIITVIDIYSAYSLGRRVHKKYPERGDGKFKSEYKYKIMKTMLIIFSLVIIANYIDVYVIKDADAAVRFIIGMFIFYQGWSILENWSSENDNPMAKTLQKIMINKAERHFNIDLSDLYKNKEEDKQHDQRFEK